MNSAYLLTGGNLGDRHENLKKALELIEKEVGKIILTSSIYETAAWGNTNQPSFLNQALLVQTTFSAQKMLKKLLEIENKSGRIRNEKMGPRLIDIDILFFNEEIIDLDDLKIPHPHIAKRRFVLTPLLEIAPEFRHPLLKRSIAELLANCTDELLVTKLDNQKP